MDAIYCRRSILVIQCALIFAFEWFVVDGLKFMSAYGVAQIGAQFSVALIPLALFMASFIPERFRPWFYAVVPAVILRDLWLTLAAAALMTSFFFLVEKLRQNNSFTGILIFLGLAFVTASNFSIVDHLPINLGWLWVMFHVSWGLKLISWIVTVRIYNRRLSWNEYLEFFFNPVFFFFTNDLNVLTPIRFFDSKTSLHFDRSDWLRSLKYTLFGLFFLLVYGAFQKYYFMNLSALGWASSFWIGGIVSVAVAIIFHAANIFLQVSMFRPIGYQLQIDMNRPWLANSPNDYWRRMHFYVREYVLDIVVKPVMMFLGRRGVSLRQTRLLILFALYFLFTCAQIGYQPFRQYRTFEISLMVTAVFIAMIGLPELLNVRVRTKIFEQNVALGRILTFAILAVGYSLIFYLRRGF